MEDMIMAKKTTLRFEPGTVVRVERDGTKDQYVSVLEDTSTVTWLETFNEKGVPVKSRIPRGVSVLTEVAGHQGSAGLATYIGRRDFNMFRYVWKRMPYDTALKIAIEHAKERFNSWKKWSEASKDRGLYEDYQPFHLAAGYHPLEEGLEGSETLMAEVYAAMVDTAPTFFDPGSEHFYQLEEFFFPTSEEAFACFKKRATAGMAGILYDRWSDEHFGTGLDAELLLMFEYICSVIRPDMNDDTQKLYGHTLGRMLYALSTEELESMRDESMGDIATRFTQAINALPRKVIVTIGEWYTKTGPETNDMPAFEELHLLE